MEWHQDPSYSIEKIMDLYNFGEVKIDTENRRVTFSILDIDNKNYYNRTFNLDSDLQYEKEKL